MGEKQINQRIEQLVKQTSDLIKKHPEIELKTIDAFLFGKIEQIDIQGDIPFVIELFNSLSWTKVEKKALDVPALLFKNQPIGAVFPNFFRITNLVFIDLFLSKIKQQILLDSNFTTQVSLVFHRVQNDHSFYLDSQQSYLLYQNTKFHFSTLTKIEKNNPIDRFISNITQAYFYSSSQHSIIINKSHYPKSSELKEEDFYLLVLPQITTTVIFKPAQVTFKNIWILDSIGVVLSLLIGIVSTVSLFYYWYFYKRTEKEYL